MTGVGPLAASDGEGIVHYTVAAAPQGEPCSHRSSRGLVKSSEAFSFVKLSKVEGALES